MPFFDFHCHPGMKPHLAPIGKDVNPWDSIHVQAEVLGLFKVGISALFTDALDSQSCLHQLWRGGVNLFGLIVHSIESHVAEELLKKDMVGKGHVLQLDAERLRRSARGDNYFNIAMEELDILVQKKFPPPSMLVPDGAQLKFIKSMAEYDRDNPNILHAILILEGSQNLFNNPTDANAKTHFIENLDKLHNQFRIFAMNVCHFQQQPVANHAFAMLFLENKPFFPTGNGITKWGHEAIKEIYKRGILVDTKHMGWKSRKDLYDLRKTEGITLPLICSHAGVTGISEEDRFNYLAMDPPQQISSGVDGIPVWKIAFLKKVGHVKGTAYNMATLQLYDEDIEEIILSGGMIGISLDQRIIGFPSDEINVDNPPVDPDFISNDEAFVFFNGKQPQTIPPRPEDDEVLSGDDAENQNSGFPAESHALYFLNQILHILFVAKKSKRIKLADGLRSVCIGSDFDGLVNPLDCCGSTAEYPDFKKQLFDLMNKKSFWRGTDFSFGELNITDLLDAVFFNNAENFLKVNYK